MHRCSPDSPGHPSRLRASVSQELTALVDSDDPEAIRLALRTHGGCPAEVKQKPRPLGLSDQVFFAVPR